jgi:hypothetical protein
MIDNRRFIRDETHPLTWFVGFEHNQFNDDDILKDNIAEPFSYSEAKIIVDGFKNENIMAKIIEVSHRQIWRYSIVITFENDADEAAFVIRASI